MAECPHGLDDLWCSLCLKRPSGSSTIEIEASFKARYEGDCSGCDLPIYVGQVVHRLSTGRYVHEGCE